MNRRKIVVASTVAMFAVAGVVAGLTLYTSFVVRAAIGDLPAAVQYFPADSQGIVGINVRAFINSPFYAKFEAEHGRKIGSELTEFIEKTGVDPRRDLDYVVAGGRSLGGGKGSGALIAIGRFNRDAITTFINSRTVPITVDYNGAKVYMIPEKSGGELEKGIAFLRDGEIGLGDLESLKAILDVSAGKPGITANETLAPLLGQLDPRAMFWFAGDAADLLARSPIPSPIGEKIAAIQSVFGTLNLTDAVSGRITANARDEESATKLADVVKGFIALGQLAGEQNAELAELMKGIGVVQDKHRIHLSVNFPADILERLEQMKTRARRVL